jgi:hypothetical protein
LEVLRWQAFRVGSPESLQFCFWIIEKRDSIAELERAMRPKKHETTGAGDLFRARLDQITNMKRSWCSSRAGLYRRQDRAAVQEQ